MEVSLRVKGLGENVSITSKVKESGSVGKGSGFKSYTGTQKSVCNEELEYISAILRC